MNINGLAKQVSIVILFLVPLFMSDYVSALDDDDLFCVYSEPNFSGDRKCGEQTQVGLVGWDLHNDISSLEIKDGYELLAYRYWWSLGTANTLSASVKDLSVVGLDNNVLSFELREVAAASLQTIGEEASNIDGELKTTAADEEIFLAITDCDSEQASSLDGGTRCRNIPAVMAAITMLLLFDDAVKPARKFRFRWR